MGLSETETAAIASTQSQPLFKPQPPINLQAAPNTLSTQPNTRLAHTMLLGIEGCQFASPHNEPYTAVLDLECNSAHEVRDRFCEGRQHMGQNNARVRVSSCPPNIQERQHLGWITRAVPMLIWMHMCATICHSFFGSVFIMSALVMRSIFVPESCSVYSWNSLYCVSYDLGWPSEQKSASTMRVRCGDDVVAFR